MKRKAWKSWEELDRVYIVAEAGLGHDGRKDQAAALIETAAECGADGVKFQLFDAKRLIHKEKLETELNLQSPNWFDQLVGLNFDPDWLPDLTQVANQAKVDLFFTPLYLEAVDQLEEHHTPYYKIASGDITFTPLLDKVSKTRKPVIISCGLGNTSEITDSLNLFLENQCSAMLLYCISKYPTPPSMIDFAEMKNLSRVHGVPVGFSDHTQSVLSPALAVANGAMLIEKHFTLSNKLPGGDHGMALDPVAFKRMVELIREAEEIVQPTSLEDQEKNHAVVARERKLAFRSLYATEKIEENQSIDKTNSLILRPNIGLSPFGLKEEYDLKSGKIIHAHQPILKEDVQS